MTVNALLAYLGAALAFLGAAFTMLALRRPRERWPDNGRVGIDVSREHSIARGARVAEIEALTGKLTGRPHETDAEAQLAARWNALPTHAAPFSAQKLKINRSTASFS